MQVRIFTSTDPEGVSYIFEGKKYHEKTPTEFKYHGGTLRIKPIQGLKDIEDVHWNFKIAPAGMIEMTIDGEVITEGDRKDLEGRLTREGIEVTTADSKGQIIYDSLSNYKNHPRERI